MSLEIKIGMVNMDEAVRRLDRLMDGLNRAIKKGLSKATQETFRHVSGYLSGARGNPGDYPVPVRTGNLRRLLGFLPPGKSKQAEGETFSTGEFEGLVYDSARYADVILLGTHSSTGHGARNYMDDGFDTFGGSDRVVEYLLREIKTVAE